MDVSLGVWEIGLIRVMLTVDEIADDVNQENCEFLLPHKEVGKQGMDAVILNSKGFGGNNASASVLAPHIVEQMLRKRHGTASLKKYKKRNEAVKENSAGYDAAAIEGINYTIYKFDHNVLDSESIEISTDKSSIAGITAEISLVLANSHGERVAGWLM